MIFFQVEKDSLKLIPLAPNSLLAEAFQEHFNYQKFSNALHCIDGKFTQRNNLKIRSVFCNIVCDRKRKIFKMSEKDLARGKMATEREATARLIWDSRLNSSIFVVGYIDRLSVAQIKEKPLLEWNSQQDIPRHRMRYIRCGELKVWDRDRRIDLISSGKLPEQAWLPRQRNLLTWKTLLEFLPQTVYQHNGSKWQVNQSSNDRIKLKKLKIVSFNVLCDWDSSLSTEQRIPEIIKELNCSDADIIALIEAHSELLEQLLLQEWVLSYYVSELVPERLKPYGILLLSKLPFSLLEHEYSPHKRVMVGTWQINDRPLLVALVHLTSDRAKDAANKRQTQLRGLLDFLETQQGDCLIVGDFNDRNNQLADSLTDWQDLWLELRPGEKGNTFDPDRNTLAALSSNTGQPGRLDRILLRKGSSSWQAVSIDLFAVDPINNTQPQLYPSDHFGLVAVLTALESQSIANIAPVYRTAVVIIPEKKLLAAIQNIRRQHDRSFIRWMPHINLLYGFIPEEHFPEAAEKIARIAAQFAAFEITLTGFNTFENNQSCTVWLQPDSEPSDALKTLQAAIESIFPQCNQQSTKYHAGFTPHLTVGQFKNAIEAQEHLTQWHPLTFQVKSIYLISRRHESPFEIRYRIDLGQLDPICLQYNQLIDLVTRLDPPLKTKDREHRQTIRAIIQQACQELTFNRTSLHLLGSSRLGTDGKNSDLDLLCLIPLEISPEKFLEDLRQLMKGLSERLLIIKQARVPLLQMNIEGVAIDLLVANSPNGILPRSTSRELDSTSWQAIIGYWEAETILNTVSLRVDLNSFRLLVRSIRAWAKLRHIHGQAWGFLGTFSWTLLAAYTCVARRSQNLKLEELLTNFFEILAEYNWSEPLGLTTAAKEYTVRSHRDYLPIITSTSPVQNSASNLTQSTASVLVNEFTRAAKISREIFANKTQWNTLFSAADLIAQSDFFLVLKISNLENQEMYRGLLKGNILGLIINLEKQFQLEIRPWNGIISRDYSSFVILGLQVENERDLLAIETVSTRFLAQFPSLVFDCFVCDNLEISHFKLFPNQLD